MGGPPRGFVPVPGLRAGGGRLDSVTGADDEGVWAMQDLKKKQRNGEMSRRLLREYDCEKERFKLLSVSTHSGPMATKQTLVSTDEAGEWRYIAPGTSAAMGYRLICAP